MGSISIVSLFVFLCKGLRPIVVINKMDKMSARHDEVLDEDFALFESLGATDEQLDFPVVFASSQNGWASLEPQQTAKTDQGEAFLLFFFLWGGYYTILKWMGNQFLLLGMGALLDSILENVPAPSGDIEGPFQFQVTSLDYSSFVGGIGIGRIRRGTVHQGQDVSVTRADDPAQVRSGKVQTLMTFMGMERVEVSHL